MNVARMNVEVLDAELDRLVQLALDEYVAAAAICPHGVRAVRALTLMARGCVLQELNALPDLAAAPGRTRLVELTAHLAADLDRELQP